MVDTAPHQACDGQNRSGVLVARLIFSDIFASLPDLARRRWIGEVCSLCSVLPFPEVCAAVLEFGSRVEELQEIYHLNDSLGRIFYVLGDGLCAAACDPDRCREMSRLSNASFLHQLQGVDKAFLRIMEGLLFIYEADPGIVTSFVQRMVKHGQVPKYALRRMVAVCSFFRGGAPMRSAAFAAGGAGGGAVMKPLEIYNQVAPHPDFADCKREITQRLRDIVATPEFRNNDSNDPAVTMRDGQFRVELYGSAVNGFETKDSDVDCTIIHPEPEGVYPNTREYIVKKCAMLKKLLPVAGFEEIQVHVESSISEAASGIFCCLLF